MISQKQKMNDAMADFMVSPEEVESFLKGEKYNVQIQPSFICNLNCAFCFQEKKSSPFLSEHVLYEKLRPLYEKTENIILVGGEVTIQGATREYLHFLKKNFPLIKLNITTNGVAFDRSWTDFAIENDIAVKFSLNAVSPDSFTASTGISGDVYLRIQKNFSYFSDEIKKIPRSNIHNSAISMVITPDSVNEMEAFCQFGIQNKMSVFLLHDMNRVTSQGRRGCQDTELLNSYIKAFELREKYGGEIEIAIPHVPSSVREHIAACKGWNFCAKYPEKKNNFVTEKHLMLAKQRICYSPWRELLFLPNGNAYICCANPFVVGNINNESIEEIISGEKIKKLRNELFSMNYSTCADTCPWNFNPKMSLIQSEASRTYGNSLAMEKDFFQNRLRDIQAKYRKVIIYGAGSYCRRFLKTVKDRMHKFEKIDIVDDMAAHQEMDVEGFKVMSWDQVQIESYECVIVASDSYGDIMSEKLKKKNISIDILAFPFILDGLASNQQRET